MLARSWQLNRGSTLEVVYFVTAGRGLSKSFCNAAEYMYLLHARA